jgi:threonine dehydrogenase-like Zn-dependent dehydrogenase
MRALFSFEQALSPAALTSVFQIVSAFIALFAIFGAIAVLTAINTAGFFTALLTAIGLLGLGAAAVFALRLLGEIWMTNLRVQDRLAVLIEQGKDRR